MSGANREHFNMTDEIRLGKDYILRACRERYQDDPELCALLKWDHGFTMPRRLSWARHERETKADTEICWKVWQGNASGDDIAQYKKAMSKFRKHAEETGQRSFCETVYSDIIWETCELVGHISAQGKQACAHIRGPAGCGKSTVAEAWALTNNHGRSVFYAPKFAGGKRQVLEDLALIRGIDRASNFNKLTQRVFDSFEQGMVLIVDELAALVRAKSQRQETLDMVRRISDISRCGLIALATGDKFESDLATGDWNDIQWWRRMNRIIDLPKQATDGDIESLWKFKFPDLDLDVFTRECLLDINSHQKGGFGQVAILFDTAIQLAGRKGREVRAKDVENEIALKLAALDIRRERVRR